MVKKDLQGKRKTRAETVQRGEGKLCQIAFLKRKSVEYS